MNELQQLAAAELCWVELSLEIMYRAACEAFIRGEVTEVPDPSGYGLSEEMARTIAVEAYRDEVAATAASFEAEAAPDTVREVPWHVVDAYVGNWRTG